MWSSWCAAAAGVLWPHRSKVYRAQRLAGKQETVAIKRMALSLQNAKPFDGVRPRLHAFLMVHKILLEDHYRVVSYIGRWRAWPCRCRMPSRSRCGHGAVGGQGP